MVGGMSYHNPPPHPRDDTASDAPKNRLSDHLLFNLRFGAIWLFGWLVFSPLFAGLFSAESSWSPLPSSPLPSFRFLGLLVWFALLSVVGLARPLIGRARSRFAQGR